MEDYKQYEKFIKLRPHVVILGAGVSCAAIPNGDKNGKKISAMNGFMDKLGMNDILEGITLHTASDNLEEIYMELEERSSDENNCRRAKEELEKRIYEYMSDFTIPDEPTVYDYLILSLTEKDLIATFNWDPLLVQAMARCMRYTHNLPNFAFLHGNVAVGYCREDNIIGNVGQPCRCGMPLSPLPLLYPIKKKDYNSDIAIAKAWKTLKNALEVAYKVTIFGYSAPKSDIEAVAMLKDAWGDQTDRKLEEIEVVDLRSEEDVYASWEDFIFNYHFSYHNSFFDTTLGKCPRRSCEATFDRLMNCKFLDGNKGFKEGMAFDDIGRVIDGLVAEEYEKKMTGKMLSNPYV